MDFSKKFNIGLTLDTDLKSFKSFLSEYHPYIHSLYFSPPGSRYYHTRSVIAYELMLPGKKRQLFKMLELAAEYGIELELLFNTLCLNDELIGRAAELMDKRGLDIASVCFLKKDYEAVCAHFPNAKYIYSFNNGFQKRSEIDEVIEKHRSDTFVLGSLFIRNNSFFSYLSGKGKEVYLILNNACSFNCETCNNTQSVCERAFKNNLKKHSVEYLYALQSIFPYELHDGIIDSSNIKCFKISNRSSNLKFIRGALDSYIGGEVKAYVQKDKSNFAFWGRAGYFWKHFGNMDIDRIFEYKKEILSSIRERSISEASDGV